MVTIDSLYAHTNALSSSIVWLGGLTITCRTCNPEVNQGHRFDSAPGHCRVTTLGKLFTHMCLCHQAVLFGTGQRPVMPRGWEGNRRSGVALAMHHGLKWFIHLRAQRPRVGDEHPAYAPAGAWFPLPFTFIQQYHQGHLFFQNMGANHSKNACRQAVRSAILVAWLRIILWSVKLPVFRSSTKAERYVFLPMPCSNSGVGTAILCCLFAHLLPGMTLMYKSY